MPLRDHAAAARGFLDRCLFLDPPPPDAGLSRTEKALLAAAFLVLAIVVQLARIGWTASLDSLWAEDGTIFLQGAHTRGFFDALGAEYAGYLVLVPRLIAEAASVLPLRDAPAVVSILSAAMVGVSALVVWWTAAGHIRSPYLRGALAIATALTPVGGLEAIDSASYVSWSMLFACFWLLLWRPRGQLGASLVALFIALAALSNPGIWFLFPLAALRALAIRDRRDLTIVLAYFGAAAIQLIVLARSSYEPVEPLWTRDIWTVFLQRVIDGAAFGLRLGGIGWELLGWGLLIGLGVAAAAGLAVFTKLRRETPSPQSGQTFVGSMILPVPPAHPDRVMAETRLGEVLLLENRINEADPVFQNSLLMQTQVFGPNSVQVADVLDSLARIRSAQGSLAEAEDYARRALHSHIAARGKNHRQTGYLQASLALILSRRGKYAEAEQLARDSLATFDKTLPSDHQYVAASEHILGEVLLETKQYARAESVLMGAMNRWKRTNAGNWRVARTESALGEAIYHQGRASEAEHYLAESYQILASEESGDRDARIKAQERITRFYVDRGEREKLQQLMLATTRGPKTDAPTARAN